MKKIYAVLSLASFLLLTACCHWGHCADRVVLAATFPVYLFAANVCANVPGVKVELLAPAQAGCPHDFSLRPADIRKLAQAGILVINGAGYEDFLAKPLAQLDDKPDIIDAGVNVPVLEEPGAIGHVNPHIFASPGNAAIMARNIGAGLARLDTPNAPAYRANAEAYAAKLTQISGRLEKIGDKAQNPKIAIEHDALAYLAGNARLNMAACLDDLNSASQLADMGKKLRQDRPSLLAGDAQYPDRMLQALARETGIPFAVLDPCAGGPENPPLDYYETVMKKNADILEKAFN